MGEKTAMKEIGKSQKIPMNYLAKVMRQLVKSDIISSVSGPNGGYSLRMEPKDLNLYRVYEAIEGKMKIVECTGEYPKNCEFIDCCPQTSIWEELESQIKDFFRTRTLSDIINNLNRKHLVDLLK